MGVRWHSATQCQNQILCLAVCRGVCEHASPCGYAPPSPTGSLGWSTAAVAEWLGRRTLWSCWHYGVRKVVSSIPGRGNIVGWVFHPTRWLERFSLIWLPVKQRVTYKIILLTFRALNGLAPIYIVDMLHRHRPTRALRSANNNDLQVPSTSSRYGDRTFAASAPRLWNALPRELKIATSLISFKILLKTHLFRIAYEQ